MSTTNIVSWKQFARDLVESGEIDPPYVFFTKTEWDCGFDWNMRALLYYLMFYDLGGAVDCASQTSTDKEFWDYMFHAVGSAKRGKARRHFRGDVARQALINLREHGGPRAVFKAMHRSQYSDMVSHIKRNFVGCQMGDYFIWKLMDICDRCIGDPVYLSLGDACVFLPDTPRKGARTLWRDSTLADTLRLVVSAIEDLPAPGIPNRQCSYPEAETILCAIYGFNKGTYIMGSDIEERHDQLRMGHSAFLKYLPIKQDWSRYAGAKLEP